MGSLPTGRRNRDVRRRILSVLRCVSAGAVFAGGLLMITPNRAATQTPPSPPDKTAAATPDPSMPSPATLKLFDEIDDIDKLRVLNPLKLTTDQMDKLADMITKAKAVYDKKVAAIATTRVVAMADEIHAVKKATLAGGEIPTAFDDKVKKIQDDFLAQRDKINAENFKSLIDQSRTILNESQIATCIKLAKTVKPANVTVTTPDDRWFNVYVLDVFINYPRIVPLLKEMKVAHP